jgi:tetratricopeptide (TPR) repeat protein
MKKPISLVKTLLVLASIAVSQNRDSARVSIHQSEAEMHRWDSMKTHASVPQLERGAALVHKGDIAGAIHAFQRAAPARPSLAYFDLGLVYFQTGKLEKALRYFRLSYRARRDSVCLDYLQNTERLLNEHIQHK